MALRIFSLLVLAAPLLPAQDRGAPLDAAQARNLRALGRLVGVVRWFHPSPGSVSADWDRITVEGVRAALPVEGPAALAAALEELLEPVAPLVTLHIGEQAPPLPDALAPPEDVPEPGLAYWRHRGFAPGITRGRFRSRLVVHPWGEPRPEEVPAPRRPAAVDLGSGLWARVPVALWTQDAAGSPRRNRTRAPRSRPAEADRAVRLAAVLTTWATLELFHPRVHTDGPPLLEAALGPALQEAAGAAVPLDDVLRGLLAPLGDSQTHVLVPGNRAIFSPPLTWRMLGEELVVTGVGPGAPPGLHPGARVTAVDSRPVDRVLAQRLPRSPGGPPGFRRMMALQRLLLGEEGSELELTLEGSAEPLRLRRTLVGPQQLETRPERVAEPEPGVLYVDLTRVNLRETEFLEPRLPEKEALIVDLRGLMQVLSWSPVQHLLEQPVPGSVRTLWVKTRPEPEAAHEVSSQGEVVPREPHLEGPACFLLDARSMGLPEVMGAVAQAAGAATLVGSRTAGAVGRAVTLDLPGGMQVLWSGSLIRHPDGSPLLGRGLTPDLEVHTTRRHLREGRDPVLEAALKVLRDR